MQALPAIEYSRTPTAWKPSRMGPDLALLALVAVYLAITGLDIYFALSSQRRLASRVGRSGPCMLFSVHVRGVWHDAGSLAGRVTLGRTSR